MRRTLVVAGLGALLGCTSDGLESSSVVGDSSCPNGFSCESLLVGARDVYLSSEQIAAGSVAGVRIIEDFAAADGSTHGFGLTDAEGAALLGEAPVGSDHSFSALVPASTSVRFQLLDRYRMALLGETAGVAGPAGDARLCGGCHESPPTHPTAVTQAPVNYDRPLAQRRSTDYSAEQVVGVPWDLALQPIFDAKCVGCHNGDPTRPGNRSLTFTSPATGRSQRFVFDLRGGSVQINVGTEAISAYSPSHLSLLGASSLGLAERGIVVTGDLPTSVVPGSARRSPLIVKLNPPRLLPTPDRNDRLDPRATPHPEDVGGQPLTNDEYRLLILMADMGGQFYSRENR